MASRTPKIFCFVNSGNGTELQCVTALSEDGEFLTGHCSSSESFAKLDIGYLAYAHPDHFSDWSGKHDVYCERYPDGFELEWVDDPKTHEGVQAAHKRHVEAGAEGTAWQRERAKAKGRQ